MGFLGIMVLSFGVMFPSLSFGNDRIYEGNAQFMDKLRQRDNVIFLILSWCRLGKPPETYGNTESSKPSFTQQNITTATATMYRPSLKSMLLSLQSPLVGDTENLGIVKDLISSTPVTYKLNSKNSSDLKSTKGQQQEMVIASALHKQTEKKLTRSSCETSLISRFRKTESVVENVSTYVAEYVPTIESLR